MVKVKEYIVLKNACRTQNHLVGPRKLRAAGYFGSFADLRAT
jgi:hypothetical protein